MSGVSNGGKCPYCKGYGDIWVGWHPTPVQCGHCHGTGKK